MCVLVRTSISQQKWARTFDVANWNWWQAHWFVFTSDIPRIFAWYRRSSPGMTTARSTTPKDSEVRTVRHRTSLLWGWRENGSPAAQNGSPAIADTASAGDTKRHFSTPGVTQKDRVQSSYYCARGITQKCADSVNRRTVYRDANFHEHSRGENFTGNFRLKISTKISWNLYRGPIDLYGGLQNNKYAMAYS